MWFVKKNSGEVKKRMGVRRRKIDFRYAGTRDKIKKATKAMCWKTKNGIFSGSTLPASHSLGRVVPIILF